MKQIPLLLVFIASFLLPSFGQYSSQNPSLTQTIRKFDEYIYTGFDDHQEHIDRFAQALKKEPNSKAYVIAYDARITYFGDSTAGGITSLAEYFLKVERVKNNELKNNNISPERVVTIEGGLREKRMVELFIVPPNAQPPVPTPTFASNKAVQCPVIDVYAPYYVWNTGLPLEFSTSVKTNNTKIKPTFNWVVSAGRIINGQGTSKIIVEQPNTAYQSITATVEVGGFSEECKTKVSDLSPVNLQVFPLEIDEFGNINCEAELARLDQVAISVHSDPLLQGYIIVYGGKQGRRNEAKARAARMKAYLVQARGISSSRIFTIDGGFRETLSSEFWLSPKGEDKPIPTPTVDIKDVKFKGTPLRIVNRSCGYGLY